MTKADHTALEEKNSYWKGRWPYLEKVIDIAMHDVQITSASEILELGPYEQALIEGSDVMDILEKIPGLKYKWDASVVPWPIEDKQYTLFIALQVWEHLKDAQKEAFIEVLRICKYAILSFPLNWNCPGNCHHGITKEIIAEWTLFIEPVKVFKVGARIIYFYKFV